MPAVDRRSRETIRDAFDDAEEQDAAGTATGATDVDADADWDETDDFPGEDPGAAEGWEIVRLRCPDCARPIALLDDEPRLPQHALLATAWNPFSSTVCPGSGRPVEDGLPCAQGTGAHSELDALLALPPELDWRTQPFSHAAPRPEPVEFTEPVVVPLPPVRLTPVGRTARPAARKPTGAARMMSRTPRVPAMRRPA